LGSPTKDHSRPGKTAGNETESEAKTGADPAEKGAKNSSPQLLNLAPAARKNARDREEKPARNGANPAKKSPRIGRFLRAKSKPASGNFLQKGGLIERKQLANRWRV